MCKNRQTSGFVYCGCGNKTETKGKETPQPQSSTVKNVKEEAQKYTNGEVPPHNKLFAATILIVTVMVFTGVKNEK